MKATVFGVVEDLKFKISEGSDQNWCFPDSAQLLVKTEAQIKFLISECKYLILMHVRLHLSRFFSNSCTNTNASLKKNLVKILRKK